MTLEIKTGKKIYLEGLDVIETNKESGYDDYTTHKRSIFNNKKWVSAESLKPRLQHLLLQTISKPARYDSEIMVEIIMELEKLLKELGE